MANRVKGEVSVDIAGASYTLCIDLNAMCALEEMFSKNGTDVTFQDVLQQVNLGKQRYIRAVFWAAFQKFHPSVTLQQVSDLVQASGGVINFTGQLVEALGIAVEATTPDPKDVKAVSSGRPRKAQAVGRAGGTGRRSTAARGRSV